MDKEMKGADDVRLMVDIFYELARRDELLASVFLEIRDSATYREKLYQYWSNEILGQSAGAGVLPGHIVLMSSPRHFVRWLELFLQTIEGNFTGVLAEKAKVVIIRKSEEFQMRLALSRF